MKFLKTSVESSVFRAIENLEKYNIIASEDYLNLQEMYSNEQDVLRRIAEKFLDANDVSNEDIRDAITNAMPKHELRKLVYKSDVITLLQDGLEKVLLGETSFSEILKAVDLDNDLSNYEDDNLQNSISDSQNHNESVKKEEVKEEPKEDKLEIMSNEPDIDYEALIPSDPDNHKNEIPHDTARPGEIEYFNL